MQWSLFWLLELTVQRHKKGLFPKAHFGPLYYKPGWEMFVLGKGIKPGGITSWRDVLNFNGDSVC